MVPPRQFCDGGSFGWIFVLLFYRVRHQDLSYYRQPLYQYRVWQPNGTGSIG